MGSTYIGVPILLGKRRVRTEARASNHPYRGEDRRGVVADDRAMPGPLFIVAAGVTVALGGTAVVAARVSAAGLDVAIMTAQFDASALALAAALAALFFVRWRLMGEAAVAWLGTAIGLYGLFTVGLGRLLASSTLATTDVIAALPSAARLVAFGAIIAGLLSAEVDASLRPARLAAAASFLAVGVAGVTSQLDLLSATPPSVLAGVWAALGVTAVWRGRRQRRHLLVWCGLAFLTFALGNVAAVHAAPDSLGSVMPSLLRVAGLAWAVCGATGGLARAYAHQSGRLLASLTAELRAEARVQAEIDAQCERAHEARNAIAAIEAATLALHSSGAADLAERTVLTEGLAAELRRLTQLVDPVLSTPTCGPFRVRDVVVGIAATARARGAAVAVDVPDGVIAYGQAAQTTQVLHNLIQNARRYGGERIEIRVSIEGDVVVIRVVDDGPGIPASDRMSVFERGVRGTTAEQTVGDGLGLYIAHRLMREQGGDLRLEDREQPGASFAVVLPVAAPLGQEVIDEGEERREVAVAS